MAPKSPVRSTSKPSLLSRARSFTKSASFGRSPTVKKAGAKAGATPTGAPDAAELSQVRYCMISLPVDGGRQFIQTVDGRKITFTSPAGKKVGDECEFAFTYGGGEIAGVAVEPLQGTVPSTPSTNSQVADKAPVAAAPAPAAPPPAAAAAPPAAAAEPPVAAVTTPVAAAAPPAAETAPPPTDVPPGFYKPLAREVTESAIEQALIQVTRPTPAAEAADLKVTEAPPAALKTWQVEAPSAAEERKYIVSNLTSKMLVGAYLIAIGAFLLMRVTGLLEEPAAALPPPPPPRPKFLGIF